MTYFYCCGFNGFKQLFSKDGDRYTFTKICIDGVVDAAFTWSSVYILTRENVYASGFVNNKPNMLTQLKYQEDIHISAVACASHQCRVLMLTTNGQCLLYDGSELRELLNFTSIEASVSSNLASKTIIQICCGKNENLAVLDTGVVFNIPSPIILTPQVKVTSVACGFEHNLLLTENGTVFSWGIGSRGQLGHGCLDDEEAPRQITALSSIVVMAVAAGGWHSVVIDDLGELWAWGWNYEGQLGFPSTKAPPSQINGDPEKLGVVNLSSTPITVPLRPDFGGKVVQIACGTRHTIALGDDGSLWGCGWNEYGQLANPTKCLNCFRMSKIETPEGKINKIICGSWNTGIIIEKPMPSVRRWPCGCSASSLLQCPCRCPSCTNWTPTSTAGISLHRTARNGNANIKVHLRIYSCTTRKITHRIPKESTGSNLFMEVPRCMQGYNKRIYLYLDDLSLNHCNRLLAQHCHHGKSP